MSAPKMSEAEMRALYDRALYEGQKAALDCTPTPMVVTQHANPLDRTSPIVFQDVVNDGVCGFAWVVVKPATHRFARWLKENRFARAGHGGGVHIWISDYNQSMARKEAHARAMSKVFSDAGINCYFDSRMD